MIDHYIHQFKNMRTDKTGGWDALTTGRAPQKPFLMLAVMDLFAGGSITENLIEVTPDLIDLFAGYWSLVMAVEKHGTLVLPFFHLRSSEFWTLLPQPGMEEAIEQLSSVSSYSQLNRYVRGACLDDALYNLLFVNESRDRLRAAVIEEYFAGEIQPLLFEQGVTNQEAYRYSQLLLENARLRKARETAIKDGEYKTNVRDQGFRRAITLAYDHRCAFCGIRFKTPEGHTAVDAAHIVPWSVSHNDDPGNGMALCRLCHWTFDEGLLGVSNSYQIVHSHYLRTGPNYPGLLSALEGRNIIKPEEETLWPDLDALEWHRVERLRSNV